MRLTWWKLVVVGLALAGGRSIGVAEEGKGTEVDLDGLKSTTPAEWKSEKVTSQFRLKQFALPPAAGDKQDGEVIVFKAGGGARANVERWKGQWAPPDGKKVEDVAVVTEMKIAGRPAVMLEIEGTYRTAPFDPKYKGAALSNFRMIAVYFEGPDNPYQIKFTGPAKTVEKYKKGFEGWLKGFK